MKASIEERVRGWSRAYRELFVERSGIHMDNGDPQHLADQRAFIEVSRWMRAAEGRS